MVGNATRRAWCELYLRGEKRVTLFATLTNIPDSQSQIGLLVFAQAANPCPYLYFGPSRPSRLLLLSCQQRLVHLQQDVRIERRVRELRLLQRAVRPVAALLRLVELHADGARAHAA